MPRVEGAARGCQEGIVSRHLITTAQAAAAVGRSEVTIRSWVLRGHLRPVVQTRHGRVTRTWFAAADVWRVAGARMDAAGVWAEVDGEIGS